jgi:hypothetical protein
MNLVLNFLPIIIIFLLVSYSDIMAEWSHTILGKFLAVALIIFYTKIDVLSGLVVCSLIILYYQTDYVEGFAPKEEIEEFSLPEWSDSSDEYDSSDDTDTTFSDYDSFELLGDV